MQDLETTLQALFAHYAIERTRSSTAGLKLQRFKQMLYEADVAVDLKTTELVFLGESRHRGVLDFEGFLNTLPRLCEYLWPEMPSKAALQALVTQRLYPLAQRLQAREEASEDWGEELVPALRAFLPVLQDIYQAYFQWELSSSSQLPLIKQKSQEALQLLMRDFDVCPLLITKATQLAIWRESGEQVARSFQEAVQEDLGKVFRLSNLVQVLFKTAQAAYREEPVGPTEKWVMLMERMELSQGFTALKKKGSRKGLSRAATAAVLDFNLSSTLKSQPSQQEAQDSDPLFLQAVEPSLSQLQALFQYYCELGDPSNSKLQSAKFLRLLKDANLVKITRGPTDFDMLEAHRREEVPMITKVEADLLFTKLVSKREGAMDFPHFLKALEVLAIRTNPNTDHRDSYAAFLAHFEGLNAQGLGGDSSYAERLLDLLQEEDVQACVDCLQRSLGYFYSLYADSKGQMSLSAFLKFLRDFGLFPDICSKGKLAQIHTALARAQSSLPSPPPSSLFLDLRTCIDALILLANDIEYASPQPSTVEKICTLAERMNQSEGPVNALRRYSQRRVTSEAQDLLQPLKTRFPHFFVKQTYARSSFRSLMLSS